MRAAPKFDTSSIFSTVYTLPRRFQHLLHLIGGERIQAASEGVQLNEIEIGLRWVTTLAAAYRRVWYIH